MSVSAHRAQAPDRCPNGRNLLGEPERPRMNYVERPDSRGCRNEDGGLALSGDSALASQDDGRGTCSCPIGPRTYPSGIATVANRDNERS
jgi:hypothetical protein